MLTALCSCLLLVASFAYGGASKVGVKDGVTAEEAAHAAWKVEHAANVEHFDWLELPEYVSRSLLSYS